MQTLLLVGSMQESNHWSVSIYEHMMFKGTKRLGTKNYQKEIPLMRSIDSLAEKMEKERLLGREQSDSLIQHYRASIFSLLEKQRNHIKKDEIWELYQNNGGTSLNAWTSDDMTAYIVTLPKNKVFLLLDRSRQNRNWCCVNLAGTDVVTEERRMRYDNRPVNRYGKDSTPSSTWLIPTESHH